MNTLTQKIIRRSIALGAVGVLGLTACGSDDSAATDAAPTATDQAAEAGVTISDAWSREPAEGQTTSAIYGVVTNNTDSDITAVSATASVSDTIELHEVLMNDEGQMSMQEKDGGFTIPAGESFSFEPGGPHIMVLGIDAATYPSTVDATLTFDDGTSIDFTAEVRAINTDAMDDMDHSDDMEEMDHSGTTDMGSMAEMTDG